MTGMSSTEGSMRALLEVSLARCLAERAGDDLVAMCLRLPEGECNDALRRDVNRDGVQRGHLARREASLGVARTDLTIQDMPSGHPLASVEAKAITSADACASRFQPWFTPRVAADVAKLRRQPVGERLFLVWKTHWFWMSRPEMYAYPRLLRGIPTSKESRRSDDDIAEELRVSHEAVLQAMVTCGIEDVSAHIVAAGEHPDVGAVMLTAHLGEVPITPSAPVP